MIKNSYIRSWRYSEENLSAVLDALEKNSGDLPGAVIYSTRHKECRRISSSFSGLPYDIVLKRYFEKRFFRYLFRPSLAYREYLGFQLASAAGMPVADFVACGEYRRGIVLKEAFFITRFAENTRSGMELTAPDADKDIRDKFLKKNLSLLAKIHLAGIVHGGFHPGNELFSISENGEMSVVWIDLATLHRVGRRGTEAKRGDVEKLLEKFPFTETEKEEYRRYYFSHISNR